MASKVFISYSSVDASFAEKVCETLEKKDVPCWIAPRDIEPGDDYTNALTEAIASARAVVLVFSSAANQSRHVRSEIRSAFDKSKTIVPIRIENVVPKKGMDHLLGNVHWLAVTPDDESDFKKKIQSLIKLLDVETDSFVPRRQINLRARVWGCTTSVAVALSLAIGLAFFWHKTSSEVRTVSAELEETRMRLAIKTGEAEKVAGELMDLQEKSFEQKEILNARIAELDVANRELRLVQSTLELRMANEMTQLSGREDRQQLGNNVGSREPEMIRLEMVKLREEIRRLEETIDSIVENAYFTWTSVADTVIEASFVKTDGDRVVLRTKSGEVKMLPLNVFSKESQDLIHKLDSSEY